MARLLSAGLQRGLSAPGALAVRFARCVSVSSSHTFQHAALRPSVLATGAARAFSTPAFVLNTPETKISTLSNGMRVATETNASQTAVVGVFIDTGSVYENAQNNGVAHFLEHMAFKGTSKRTRGALEVEVENMGGSLNAFTSREHTVYQAKVFRDDVGKAVDILADILQNSTLSEQHIERERDVILTEMREVGKNTQEVVFDYLHSIAFQDTPLGRTILGPAENIRSLQKKDLQDFVSTHYTGDRMVVVGAGAVDHDQLVSEVEQAFSGLPSKSSVDFAALPENTYSGSAVTHQDSSMSEVHLAIAVEGVSWSSPDHLPMMVIQNIIGNWDRSLGAGKNVSSRLAEVIAREGLATQLTTFNTCYNSTGLFGAYLVSNPHAIEDLSCEVLSEFVRIGHSVTDTEVEWAKNKLKASMLMTLDGNAAIAEDIGRQVLTLGRRHTAAELFKRIDDIDTATVRRVADNYFQDVCPAVVGVGDVQELPDYNQLRGWTYWNRL